MSLLPKRAYLKLLEEAHGCEMPEVASSFAGWEKLTLHYDVRLVDWGVAVKVPMPDLGVLIHLSLLHPSFVPELPWEHAEYYIDRYQVRAEEALSYALASLEQQPEAVRRHLIDRFGPMLGMTRRAAKRWWMNVLECTQYRGGQIV